MREIIFRGKCKETNEIIVSEGFLKHKDGTVIVTVKQNDETLVTSQVFKDTLQQYTGFEDVNGVGIFEGDRLWSDIYNCVGDIVFKDGSFIFEHKKGDVLLKDVMEDDKETQVISEINN